ncbi:hypothetical protein OF83DRAFT_1094561 [Amylostereum chailletii]|nr:hypothetical protein OF83DRAFT_1094561 [Amylostereum chailletii]
MRDGIADRGPRRGRSGQDCADAARARTIARDSQKVLIQNANGGRSSLDARVIVVLDEVPPRGPNRVNSEDSRGGQISQTADENAPASEHRPRGRRCPRLSTNDIYRTSGVEGRTLYASSRLSTEWQWPPTE